MSHRKLLKSHVSTCVLVLVAGGMSVPAYAACTIDASHNYSCTGATTTPLTLYDQAAQFQPIAGSNSYTPANPAFPAASNPKNPGYNPNPPDEIATFAAASTFITTVTTANRATVLSDGGQVAANYSNTENPAVNNVVINNNGAFTLINTQSAARASSIVADSQVNNFTVNNNAGATIAVSQTAPAFTAFNPANLTAFASGTPTAYAARYANTAFAITSAFYSDDNTNEFIVNNAAGASVTATGHFATTYYGRADTTITNNGTIANTDYVATDTISQGHWAIAAYAGTEYTPAPNTNPDSTIVIPNANGSVTIDDTSALTLTNNASGKIKGDILALDITPLVYAAAVGASTNPFPNPTQTTLLQLPVSASNGGPRDSNIENFGSIQGNFYLGSGTHVIDNAAGATVQGSVYVDQRPVQVNFSEPNPGTVAGTYASKGGTDFNGNTCPAAGANTTNAGCATTSTKTSSVVGGQSLTLTNEGTMTGDIRIFDQATSVNSVTLTGAGFTGNVVAVNGTGANSLVLDSDTMTLASVQKFSSIDLMQTNATVTNGVSLVNNAQISTTIYGPGGTTAAPSTNLGTINGTLTLAGTTNITPTIAAVVHDGDVYQVASGVTGAGATTPGAITVDGSTALVSFTPDTSTGKLLLDAGVKNASTIKGITGPGAQTINGLTAYDGDNANVQALAVTVENLSTNAQVAKAGRALSPIVNGADIQMPINITNSFHQQIDVRLDQFIFAQIPSSGRSADLGVPHTAPVYGVLPPDGAWIEGVGGNAHQDPIAGVAGYSADFEGFIGGFDRLVVPGLRVGVAGGYVDTQVNGQSNLQTNERIQTYQGLGYAEFAQGNYYLRGSVGYGGVDYHSLRQVTFAGFNDTAVGQHNGNILTARGEAGLPFEYAGSLLVPYGAFTYGHLTQDAYSETSNLGAGFNFAGTTNDSERAEIGGKVLVPLPMLQPLFATVALEARAAYVHEFGNVGQTVDVAFAGGAPFVVSGPVPNRDMVDFGVGLKMGAGPVTIDVSYNGLARSTFYDQYGLLRFRYAF